MTEKHSFLQQYAEQPVPLRGYIALILIILFFSGWFANSKEWFGFLDFSTLNGTFGKLPGSEKSIALQGGYGARHGFLFSLSLIPGVMLALGAVAVAEKLDALRAAQKLLNPIMRPILGLPGIAGLALIGSLQSSDAGGAMTRDLYDKKLLTEAELSTFGAFQFSAGSSITVYLTIGIALFPYLSVSFATPLGVILLCKILGTSLMRLYLKYMDKKENAL